MDEPIMNVINYLQTGAGFFTQPRVFDYDYLLYVHRGKGRFRIGNTTYSTGMGDLLYCPPGVANTIFADPQDPFLLSGIEFLAPRFRKALPEKTSLLNHSFLTGLILEMVQEYRCRKTGSREICNALLTALLENLSRTEPAGEGDPAEALVEYLSQNFCRPVTHAQLSDRFNCHKNTINRMLERKTGLPLKDYLITLRLRKACELLKYTHKSVAEIAELCGYQSDIYFSRQFREKVGITPGKFRRTHSAPE